MNACLFLIFRLRAAALSDADITKLGGLLKTVPKLARALVHTSSSASDPYVKDEGPPDLALQLYFATPFDLEAATSHASLQGLGPRGDVAALTGADIAQQAMLVRSFAVPDPAFGNPAGTPYCTYLVSYEG